MARRRKKTPEDIVAEQTKSRNDRLDAEIMQMHIDSAGPERISIQEFERRISQMHLSKNTTC